jgi:hypothetical protein
MKVSSAPSQSSALDTWLHDSAAIEASASPTTSRGVSGATGQSGSISGRDSAEGLLGLQVWDENAAWGHRLVTAIPAPEPLSGAAQVWASHIFAPLV